MAGLRVADLRRDAQRLATIAELAARLDRLKAAIAAMAARLERLECEPAVRKDQRDGEAEIDIAALIG